MNNTSSLMNNTSVLAPNSTTMATMPPPPAPELASGKHNTSAIIDSKVPMTSQQAAASQPIVLTYASRHGRDEQHEHNHLLADLNMARTHGEPESLPPHHAVPHHHFFGESHHVAKEALLELEPCNDRDPDQMQIFLFSHRQDHYRPAAESDSNDKPALRSPTALLIGCTSRLNGERLAYKVEPAFRSVGSRAKYANYVRKRNLSSSLSGRGNERRSFLTDDGVSTCNSYSDRFDVRFKKGGIKRKVVKRMLGASPDENVDQVKIRAEDALQENMLVKRSGNVEVVTNTKRMERRDAFNDFIRRWADGDEKPRAFEPLDEPLFVGRDDIDSSPLEIRSLYTKHTGLNHGAAQRRLKKRGEASNDDLNDAFEKRSTTNGGGNSYAGYVGRWTRRALSDGDMHTSGAPLRRSIDTAKSRMIFVRRSADAVLDDFDKRSSHDGSHHWGRGRHWRRDLANNEELEKRSWSDPSCSDRGRRWRRLLHVNDNDDDDAVTVRSVISTHGDIVARDVGDIAQAGPVV